MSKERGCGGNTWKHGLYLKSARSMNPHQAHERGYLLISTAARHTRLTAAALLTLIRSAYGSAMRVWFLLPPIQICGSQQNQEKSQFTSCLHCCSLCLERRCRYPFRGRGCVWRLSLWILVIKLVSTYGCLSKSYLAH